MPKFQPASAGKGNPGPKKGYKQSPEHIEKRKRYGAEHHGWKGDGACVRAWKRRHKMIECGPYSCTMTVKACRARHKRALKAKKTTKLGTMPILSDEWMALAKCRKCEVQP